VSEEGIRQSSGAIYAGLHDHQEMKLFDMGLEYMTHQVTERRLSSFYSELVTINIALILLCHLLHQGKASQIKEVTIITDS